jgi:predicted permease
MTTATADLTPLPARRFEALIQDLRYAARGIRNRPGFTVAVVLTLALGVGANTAMFSVVDRLLFRPPPLLRSPALTHRVYVNFITDRGKEFHSSGMPYARYIDLVNTTTAFARIVQFTTRSLAVGVGTDARDMQVGVVSANFFSLFDAPAALGRYYAAAEDSAVNPAPVAVMSYGYWQTTYGGRRDALGQTVQIGATRYTIIGAAPKGFVGLWPSQPPAFFIPISTYGAEMGANIRLRGETWSGTYHWTWSSTLAERKPGVTIAAANADLTAALRRSNAAQEAAESQTRNQTRPKTTDKTTGTAESILSERGPNQSSVAKVATWISGVALVVWLIACANVANLLLARALKRRREIAVRLALGVSRTRLAMQLLTESTLLALMGGVAGAMVAQWGGAVLRAQLLPKTASGNVITDPRTLVFAGVAAVIAGLLTGLAPVFQAGRADLTNDLKTGQREGAIHRSRLRVALLVFQGALSVVLLVGAGLFVRSVRNVETMPLGYDPDPVMNVDLQMRGEKLDSTANVTLRDRLLGEAAGIPGVTHAARHITMPFWSTWNMSLTVPGVDSVDRLGSFNLNAVTPDYFATMGTRVLRGRGITDQDVNGAPRAMVVSEAMAKALWPGKDPIGQCVKVSNPKDCHYVVGVAENIKSQSLSDDTGLYYYLASAQFHPDQGGLFIRMHGDGALAKETIRKRLQPLMPGAAYVTVTPLSDILGGEKQSWKLGATLFTVFGLLALVLAAIGLYSVIAYSVAQRTNEMGIRVALGAEMQDLVKLVLTEGMKLSLIGIVLGTVIALVVGRWVKPLLFNVSPYDPVVFAGVAVVLIAVAALASLIPARRAGRVDPMQALRAE